VSAAAATSCAFGARAKARALLTVLALGLLPVGRGFAQAGAAESGHAASPVSAEYARAIEDALEEYRLAHYEEARSLFERAHAIEPSARTLRGMGMVEFELRHYVHAAELLDAALKSDQRPLTADQREAVERLLARTKLFIGEYKLNVEPEPGRLTIEVDGKPVSLAPDRRVVLEAGEHTLRISAPDAEPSVLKLDVKGGAAQTLQVTLLLKPEHAEKPRDPVKEQSPRRSPLGPALLGSGGGIALVGGALGVTALLKADSAIEHTSQADQAHRMAIAADVLISVGVATAVVGLVLLLKRAGSDRKKHAGVRRERADVLRVKF
jgi:tetratricopeptide (TPR) repeat protein